MASQRLHALGRVLAHRKHKADTGKHERSHAGRTATDETHHESAKPKNPWTRPDKINGLGVTIALVALIVPFLVHFYSSHFEAPQAAITSVHEGQRFPGKRIAVSGNSRHIPDDSDLWLTVSGMGHEVYPIAELNTDTSHWTATEKQVCFRLGPQSQRLDVWLTPDTNDGAFVKYMQGNNSSGFYSVPAGFVKEDQVTISITGNADGHC